MEITDDKKTQIIKAAIRRFSHFGIAKTTMSEIAEDTHLSKANLYYYFPDKISLIEEIAEVILAQTNLEVEEIFSKVTEVEQRLLALSDFKFQYFKKYQLLVQDLHDAHGADPRMQALGEKMFEKERERIALVFEEGIRTGQLVTMDVHASSNLYVSIQRGLMVFHIITSNSFRVIDEALLQSVHILQKQATHVFVNGIIKKL